MSRLIDADALIDYLGFGNTEEEREENVGEIVTLEDFDNQPTAFDLDKVVERLEEVKRIMASPVTEDCFGEECRSSDCMICLVRKAIEIVKEGGIE